MLGVIFRLGNVLAASFIMLMASAHKSAPFYQDLKDFSMLDYKGSLCHAAPVDEV